MKRNLKEIFKSMKKKNDNISFASSDELKEEADSSVANIILFSKLARRRNPATNKRGSGSN